MNTKLKTFLAIAALVFIFGLVWQLGERSSSDGRAITAGESGDFLRVPDRPSLWSFLAKADGWRKRRGSTTTSTTTITTPPPPSGVTTFTDSFLTTGKIEEAGSISESADPNWWVNSGAWFLMDGGIGKTIQGDLPSSDSWFQLYLKNNPVDTDGGAHPQNIFRFVQRGQWENFTQQAYFKINKLNLSNSPNRNASNGLFLFNRYQSGDNLYYVGVRVDGAAVIKKKINGTYYTMAYRSIFPGSYSAVTNPNLLPLNSWIGLKNQVKTNADGTVTIAFYLDQNRSGNWTLALQTIDDGRTYGGSTIAGRGYAGIRADFMDVEFDDYNISQ